VVVVTGDARLSPQDLRMELWKSRQATAHQRRRVRHLRRLLKMLERHHRAGDDASLAWLIENWRSQLAKWADETKEAGDDR
jgi:hypothetical protein